MDFLIFAGIILLFLVMTLAVPDVFVNPAAYIQFPAGIMVLGGMVALFIIASTMKDIKSVIRSFLSLIKKNRFPTKIQIVDKLVELSILSQKEGRLALEGAGEGFDDGFLNNGLQMIVNKLQSDFIRIVLENELQEIDSRHNANIDGINFLGSIAPLVGMFGTIVGIVQVLQNMTDPRSVGPAMALALLTTLYGVFVSGFIMQPIAKRLSQKNEEEILIKTIMIEGLIMIAKNEIPIKVETYLRGFLSNIDNNKNKKEKTSE
jgi:chemotaxis protein MotA